MGLTIFRRSMIRRLWIAMKMGGRGRWNMLSSSHKHEQGHFQVFNWIDRNHLSRVVAETKGDWGLDTSFLSSSSMVFPCTLLGHKASRSPHT